MPEEAELAFRTRELDALGRAERRLTCVWGLAGAGVHALVDAAKRRDPRLEVIERADLLDEASLGQKIEAAARGGARVVLTSRRRLVVRGAEQLFVAPLSSDDAVALLTGLLRRGGAHPAWASAPESLLRELTAGLGELPGLVIELARRAAIVGPSEIAAVLDAHEASRADLGAALATLSTGAKELLDVLAVSPRGLTLATLAGAKALAETERALLELSDCALLSLDARDVTHYALVAPVARAARSGWDAEAHMRARATAAQILAARMAAGEATATERTNVVGLLPARATLTPDARRAFVDEIERLVRVGLPVSSLLAALDDALSEADSYAHVEERARLLVARADARLMAGAHGPALADLSEAKKLAIMIDDASLEERAICVLSRARHWEARIEEGLAALPSREPGDPSSAEDVRLSVAILTYGLGDVPAALAYLERASESPDAGLRYGLAALMLRDLGEVERARARFRDALAVAQRSGDAYLEATVRNWLALSCIDDGDLDTAARELGAARATLEAFGEEQFYRAVLGHLGIVAHLEHRLGDAESLLLHAVTLAEKGRDLYRRCHFLAHLGAVRAKLGRRSEALLDFAAASDALEHAEHVNPNLPPIVRLLRGVLDGSPTAEEPRAAHSSDVRIAARAAASGAVSAPARALAVGAAGRWFSLDGGPTVSLVRRKPLARIVEALAARVASGEITGLNSGELLAAGWPVEAVSRRSGMHRVHVAVSELRKLGLAVLVSDDRGYRLDASVTLESPRADVTGS